MLIKKLMTYICVLVVALIVILRFGLNISTWGEFTIASLYLGASVHPNIEILAKDYIDDNLSRLAPTIANTLQKKRKDNILLQSAIFFATEHQKHPKINEGLIVYAFEHPDLETRCYWKKKLELDYYLTIESGDRDNKVSNTFKVTNTSECKKLETGD